MRRLFARVSSVLDASDVIYMAGVSFVGAGAWLLLPAAGLIAIGLLLILPATVDWAAAIRAAGVPTAPSGKAD